MKLGGNAARAQSARPQAKQGNPEEWTQERIAALGKKEIQALRDNAERLGAADLAALCTEVLSATRPRPSRSRTKENAGPAARTSARRLIPRGRAFEARGVSLRDPKTSWGGVRKADGVVVFTLWADAVLAEGAGCAYRLWAPNVEGAHPWSDAAGGRERLEHCKAALSREDSEGLLVYGQPLAGHQPEDRAHSILGVDPETVLRFRVEQRGEEYWAVWGAKSQAA